MECLQDWLIEDVCQIVDDYLSYRKIGQRVMFSYSDLEWWSSWMVMTGTIEQILPHRDTYVIRCDDGSLSCFLISDGTGITSSTLTHLEFLDT